MVKPNKDAKSGLETPKNLALNMLRPSAVSSGKPPVNSGIQPIC